MDRRMANRGSLMKRTVEVGQGTSEVTKTRSLAFAPAAAAGVTAMGASPAGFKSAAGPDVGRTSVWAWVEAAGAGVGAAVLALALGSARPGDGRNLQHLAGPPCTYSFAKGGGIT